jgi:maleylacetoacetate isomerase
MKLHGYYRSSGAYRVRIALNLKGLTADQVPVHLRRGEQNKAAFRKINPEGLVPVLEHAGEFFSQSLAIIDYLDELEPQPPLLPVAAVARAHVRALALAIACDISPLNNLRVLQYLKSAMGLTQTHVDRWYAHWISTGLAALEARLAGDARTGTYCFGDTPGLADICLVPQVYNAERMLCDLDPYPTVRRIAAAARALPAFAAAAPERQPDAE